MPISVHSVLTPSCARLPRRYSERRPSSAFPTIGSSGSTPLHFAAANGHTHVVRLLLLHGAHADRADKHGVTPEMLAREGGRVETADVLRAWVRNKDSDLREREREAGGSGTGGSGSGSGMGALPGGGGALGAGGWGLGDGADDDDGRCDRKGSTGDGGGGGVGDAVRRRLNVKHSIDQALNTLKAAHAHAHHTPDAAAVSTSPVDDFAFHPDRAALAARRPSVPENDYPPYSNSPSPARRPRSAGQPPQSHSHSPAHPQPDDERPRAPSTASATAARKLGSKYSLRNLFKKAGDTPGSGNSAAHTPPPPEPLSPSPSPHPRPLPLPAGTGLLSLAPLRVAGDSSSSVSLAPQGDAHAPGRTRSGSGAVSVDEELGYGNGGNGGSAGRPSILRSHGRSSSGQAQSRAIRFDEAAPAPAAPPAACAGAGLVGRARSGVARALGGLERSLSPGRAQPRRDYSFGEEEGEGGEEGGGGIDEEEYGEEVGAATSRLAELQTESLHSHTQHRARGASFASSTCSLSPITSPDSASPEAEAAADFPFSINRPPPLDEQLLTVPAYFPDDGGGEKARERGRGDSVSSMSTDGSAGRPPLSWSSTTTASSAAGPAHGVGTRRAHVPGDIDIRSISSHAQAEALVLRAQRSILEMDIAAAGAGGGLPSPLREDEGGSGRSPLSARLAAYGETLALERRLKRVEEDRDAGAGAEEGRVGSSPTLVLFTRDVRRGGSPRVRDGKLLGGEAPSRTTNPSRARIRQPRRPNTSDSGQSLLCSRVVCWDTR